MKFDEAQGKARQSGTAAYTKFRGTVTKFTRFSYLGVAVVLLLIFSGTADQLLNPQGSTSTSSTGTGTTPTTSTPASATPAKCMVDCPIEAPVGTWSATVVHSTTAFKPIVADATDRATACYAIQSDGLAVALCPLGKQPSRWPDGERVKVYGPDAMLPAGAESRLMSLEDHPIPFYYSLQ